MNAAIIEGTSVGDSVQATQENGEPSDHPESLVITREENRILKLPSFELAHQHQQNLHHLLHGIHNDPDGFSGCVNRKRQRDFIASCAPTMTVGGSKVQLRQEEGQVDQHNKPKVGISSFHSFRQIGKGKFSVVFFARMAHNNCPCALKKVILPATKNQAQAAQMQRHIRGEIQLLQSVNHPNIVRFLDSFTERGNLYIVLEWGGICDMRQIISRLKERKQTMERRTVWIFFSQICEAVKHMHEKRIMHRDIKPANMFVDIEHGLLKVGDLGLSRAMHEASLKAFSQVGTPLYMSPEVLKGDGHDFASDLWSLGCVLYELAMLRSPFEGSNGNLPKADMAKGGETALFQLFQNIIKCKFPPLEPKYGSDMKDLIHAMLQLNPRSRPDITKVANCAMQARCSYADDKSSSVSRNGSVKLDGFVSNPSTIQRNDWYLEQNLKPATVGEQTDVVQNATGMSTAEMAQNDGFTSFVGKDEDLTETSKELLRASTNAGRHLRDSLNAVLQEGKIMGDGVECSLAVSESMPDSEVLDSRPGTASEQQDPNGGNADDMSMGRLSRASSFDLNEDESHYYDMGDTSNMTVEDSQDDIVCIDPSVIRQLRIQHGLDVSKECENEDDDDSDVEGIPSRTVTEVSIQEDDSEILDEEDDYLNDDTLSESERLVDDVEAMRLDAKVDGSGDSGVHVNHGDCENEPPRNFNASHSSRDSINMSYSSCDSQCSPTRKGNQKLAKDEDDSLDARRSAANGTKFHETFPPPEHTKPSGEEMGERKRNTICTSNCGVEFSSSKDGVVLPLIGKEVGAGMSRSEPHSGSRSMRMFDEPINKEFQSEELVGTMSDDIVFDQKNNSALNAADAAHQFTSSSLGLYTSKSERHPMREMDLNDGSGHRTSPPIRERRSNAQDDEGHANSVVARVGETLGTGNTAPQGDCVQTPLQEPLSKRILKVAPQLPKVKNESPHEEFSDAVTNPHSSSGGGKDQKTQREILHPQMDSAAHSNGTSHIPPPILVPSGNVQDPKLEARNHQKCGEKHSGSKRNHSQLTESPPNVRSSASFAENEHPAHASKYLMHRLKRLLLPGRGPTGTSIPRGHNNKYKIVASNA